MNTESQSASPTPPPEQGLIHNSSQPPRKRRRWIVWLGAICILCSGGVLLSQRSTAPSAGGGKKGKKGSGIVPVAVSKVGQGDMGVYISAIGTVTPVYTVTVASRVVGQLVEVHYKEGQIVHKGDLLAVIDPRPYEAALVQAQGQLARDQALLKNAYIDLNRYKTIYEQRAIPEQTLATQQATVDQDEGVVKLDQGNLDAAKVNVDYTKITSPIDGRVGLRLVDPGNIVPANGTTGLVTIAQLQPITIIFPFPEDYLDEVVKQMRVGHKLTVQALDRAQQKQVAEGTLLTIDNQVDTTTGTVKARATFPNKDLKLFPNEFVNAKLLVKMLYKVNLVPTAAIQRNADVAYVYVVQPNKTVQSHNIQIADTEGNYAAATGVNPGDTVVVDGFDQLQDGTKISVKSEPAPSGANPANENAISPQTQQGSQNTQISSPRQPAAPVTDTPVK